jgi:flagellin
MRRGQNGQCYRKLRSILGAERTLYKEIEMSSILTNNGAMVALQTLKSINANLTQTQAEISTGKSVGSAKDNSALWAISKVMESDVKGFEAISGSLALGESTVAVARNASETVTDLLTEIKGKIVAAQESNVDRTKIQEDITALRGQIGSVIGAAQFNGLNLVDGSSAEDLSILSSLDRAADGTTSASNIDIARQNLSLTGVASTQAFGAGAVTALDLITADTTAAAAGGTATITINSVTDGSSYGIQFADVELTSSGGGTATGTRDFEFVASGSDSTESVAEALRIQISAYFESNTDSGDYAVSRTGSTLTLTNNTATILDADTSEFSGGTAGGVGNAEGLGDLSTIDVTTDVGASSALLAIDTLIDKSIDAAASFGSAQGRIETQTSFIGKLTDSLKSGIGSLVDADLEETSAKLQALQVQQQLGTQALSIANQAPQSILSLFR